MIPRLLKFLISILGGKEEKRTDPKFWGNDLVKARGEYINARINRYPQHPPVLLVGEKGVGKFSFCKHCVWGIEKREDTVIIKINVLGLYHLSNPTRRISLLFFLINELCTYQKSVVYLYNTHYFTDTALDLIFSKQDRRFFLFISSEENTKELQRFSGSYTFVFIPNPPMDVYIEYLEELLEGHKHPEEGLDNYLISAMWFPIEVLPSILKISRSFSGRDKYITHKNWIRGCVDAVLGAGAWDRDTSEIDGRKISLHESAHAVITMAVAGDIWIPVYLSSLSFNNQYLGILHNSFALGVRKVNWEESVFNCSIIISVAGMIAEEVLLGEKSEGSQADIDKSFYYLERMAKSGMFSKGHPRLHSPDELNARMQQHYINLCKVCEALIIKNKDVIEEMAKVLHEEKELFVDDIIGLGINVVTVEDMAEEYGIDVSVEGLMRL